MYIHIYIYECIYIVTCVYIVYMSIYFFDHPTTFAEKRSLYSFRSGLGPVPNHLCLTLAKRTTSPELFWNPCGLNGLSRFLLQVSSRVLKGLFFGPCVGSVSFWKLSDLNWNFRCKVQGPGSILSDLKDGLKHKCWKAHKFSKMLLYVIHVTCDLRKS